VALGVVEQPGERRLLFFKVAESSVAHGIVEQPGELRLRCLGPPRSCFRSA